MSDESSDDEPIISSPDATDNEDDDDNDKDNEETRSDVFKYTARKFQKRNTPSSPSPPGRRRRHHVDAVHKKLNLLEHQQQVRDLKLRKRLHGHNEDSSEDDNDGSSDDIQIINDPKAKKTKQQELQNQRKNHQQQEPPKSAITIDISDDSDDDATPARVSLTSLKCAPKEVLDVLQRSKVATNRLQQAQLYHAEDVEVQVDQSPVATPLTKRIATSHKVVEVPKPIHKPAGRPLCLTCRCQIKVNGNKQPTAEQDLTVHENQSLSALMDKIMTAYTLPPTARITMTFDGLPLDTKRTAASYEIEDGDLIDVTASIIAMPSASVAPVSSGSKLTLTLRCKVNKKVEEISMQLGKNEIFQNLLNDYIRQEKVKGKCIFHFDGEVLGLNQTPSNYDMEDGDLIDVLR